MRSSSRLEESTPRGRTREVDDTRLVLEDGTGSKAPFGGSSCLEEIVCQPDEKRLAFGSDEAHEKYWREPR